MYEVAAMLVNMRIRRIGVVPVPPERMLERLEIYQGWSGYEVRKMIKR